MAQTIELSWKCFYISCSFVHIDLWGEWRGGPSLFCLPPFRRVIDRARPIIFQMHRRKKSTEIQSAYWDTGPVIWSFFVYKVQFGEKKSLEKKWIFARKETQMFCLFASHCYLKYNYICVEQWSTSGLFSLFWCLPFGDSIKCKPMRNICFQINPDKM